MIRALHLVSIARALYILVSLEMSRLEIVIMKRTQMHDRAVIVLILGRNFLALFEICVARECLHASTHC